MTIDHISVTSTPSIHKIHSHNDEHRNRPLIQALKLGIPSIEADVWYLKNTNDENIYVGHKYMFLTAEKTLKKMYLDPIFVLLEKINSNLDETQKTPIGIFESDPNQTLYLWMDIKTDHEISLLAIEKLLKPFRLKNWLTTYYSSSKSLKYGPVTIIASGNAPLNLIVNNDKRDIFFDAPLGNLDSVNEILKKQQPQILDISIKQKSREISNDNGFIPEISLFASGSLTDLIGNVGFFWDCKGLNKTQIVKLKTYVNDAKSRGLLTRIWGVPNCLFSKKVDVIWKQLVDEVGVDFLNVDDLELATTYI